MHNLVSGLSNAATLNEILTMVTVFASAVSRALQRLFLRDG
jgi:hypothetical protein